MLKNIFIVTSIITMSHVSAMEIEQTSYAMKIEQASLAALPGDMKNCILTIACPPIDLLSMDLFYSKEFRLREEYDTQVVATKKYLPIIAQKIMALRSVCTYFNTFITENIASLLHLDKNNIDPFLIESIQANIPYFIKFAIAQGADTNTFYMPSGFTPLLYAAENNCYSACALLLANGADVNLKMKSPGAFGFGYNPHCNWPIHMAIKNGDAKLVALFIAKGANLTVRLNGPHSKITLFSVVLERNEPAILEALLTSCPDSNCQKNWGKEEIEDTFALMIVNKPDDQNRQQCKHLLQQALRSLNDQ